MIKPILIALIVILFISGCCSILQPPPQTNSSNLQLPPPNNSSNPASPVVQDNSSTPATATIIPLQNNLNYNQAISALYNISISGENADVSVLPVFFVPADIRDPTDDEKQLLMMHLLITQARYRQLLKGRDTFTIGREPVVYHSSHNLSYFVDSEDQGGAKIITELMSHFGTTKENLPYIFLTVVMNPCSEFPLGGGRPINGGLNNGGGMVVVSSFRLDQVQGNFQETIQHELGHSFGLVHADTYGYDQATSDSVMAYKPNHDWIGFNPPSVQSILIPEDMQALALNKKVFPNFYFNPATDMPKGYQIQSAQGLAPMPLDIHGITYKLYIDGVLMINQENINSEDAIVDFAKQVKNHPSHKVTGSYGGNDLRVDGIGYELYWDGLHVNGPDALNSTLDHAISNIQWNEKTYPYKAVVGLYNGQLMPQSEATAPGSYNDCGGISVQSTSPSGIE